MLPLMPWVSKKKEHILIGYVPLKYYLWIQSYGS